MALQSTVTILLQLLVLMFTAQRPAWAISDAVATSYPPVIQGNKYVRAVVFDSLGNRFVTGSITGTVDFNPGVGLDAKTGSGNRSAFISRYNADGTYAWTQVVTSASFSDAICAVLSPDELTVYAGGDFQGTINMPGSPTVSADAPGQPPPDAPESTASNEPAVIANEDVDGKAEFIQASATPDGNFRVQIRTSGKSRDYKAR